MNPTQRTACLRVVCALLISIVGCQRDTTGSPTAANGEISACDRATKFAASSIAAGDITLKEYPPLPSPPGHGEYTKLLRERCNVEYEVISNVPQGVSRNEFVKEIACWNEAMNSEIKLKYGDKIFAELHKLARARWLQNVNSQGKQ